MPYLSDNGSGMADTMVDTVAMLVESFPGDYIGAL